METVKQKLGKVSITVDKDEHSLDKEYDKLVVVYKKTAYTETVDGETVTKYNYRTYISRKPVPIGKEITNKDYWIQLGSVEEHIAIDYNTFKDEVLSYLSSFDSAEKDRVLAENTRISNETSRIENENIRETQETVRKEHEDARILAENVREQQEGSPTDEPDSNGSRWARYKKAEDLRDTSYYDKESKRDTSYTRSEQNRNNSYDTAEGQKTDTPNLNGSRWAQFKAKEDQRQQDYEAYEGNKDSEPDRDGSRWERYKQAEEDREESFNLKEIDRTDTFDNSEQERQTTFNNNEGTVNDSPSNTGSRWARFKFNEASRQTAEQTRQTNESNRQTQETARQQAESQRTSTFNQSQAERQQAYQNAEGTSSDEPSATGSRWARYNKAEQDRNTAIEDLKETKANKDGYYSQMTVGASETLVGQTVDSDAYLIRPTGNESNEVANGVASVLGMEGNSAVWNQLLKQGRLVDMGLPSGLLWATSNIDITQEDGFAASPFQYGCTMFSWGNIEGHNTPASGTTFDYNWGGGNAQEPWYEGQVYGGTPGAALVSNILANDSQDAARKNVGSLFKMPSSTQFQELINNCIFINANGDEIPSTTTDKRVTVNGVVGLYLQSKANGNRLFFSASGYGDGQSWGSRGSKGVYWSSTFYSSRYALSLYFISGGVYPQYNSSRFLGFAVRPVVNPNTVDTGHSNHRYYVDKDIIVDLTLLNHSNIAPSSTDATVVKEKIAQLVGVKPNFPYNTGTILSAQTLGIKTYGQNLLNPTTRQAKLIPYTWEENSNVYTIKNVPSGATATFTPDATGVAETVDISGGSLDITSYGSGILELSAATADTYVCMKWDEGKDDDVVPYEDHTYDFDVRKVYGKISGAGELVQCFPNGLRRAGTAKDTLTAAGANKVIGDVDLGSLMWSGENGSFSANIANIKKVASAGAVPNVVCTKYLGRFWSQVNTIDGIYAYTGINPIIIQDKTTHSASTSTQFKTAMNGVKLNYELATPIIYTDLVYRDRGIDRPLSDALMDITINNWSIEEQLLTPYDENGNPTAIPATIKTQYGMDAVEAIDTLQKTCYFADDVKANLQALLTCINTNCAETLGGTFAISDTAINKVFAFSFTPNTEPDVEPTNEGE